MFSQYHLVIFVGRDMWFVWFLSHPSLLRTKQPRRTLSSSSVVLWQGSHLSEKTFSSAPSGPSFGSSSRLRIFAHLHSYLLFPVNPIKGFSRDMLSRWLVSAIKTAGVKALVEGTSPKALQTRNISSSWALFTRVVVEDICKAAFLAFCKFFHLLLPEWNCC